MPKKTISNLFNSKQQKTTISPHYIRPTAAEKAIDESFNRMLADERGYIFRGQPGHSLINNGIHLTDQHLIQSKLENEATSKPITVLDVGSGDYSYLDANKKKFPEVETFGISCDDKLIGTDKEKKQARNDPHYNYANAE